MSLNWSDYESYTLGNRHLDSFLGQRDPIAFFTSQSDPEAKPRLVQLVAAGGDEAERVQESWRRAAKLSHEHLLRPYEIGASTLDGIPVAYAVLDLPDDDLSEILAKRSLGGPEARSIMASVKSGLEYLHGQGLCHGAVAPANIFFVGDTPKLSIDGIAAADASCKEADLRQLRVRVAQAVSAKAGPSVSVGVPGPAPGGLSGILADPVSPAAKTGSRSSGGNRVWIWVAAVIVVLFFAGVFLSRAGHPRPSEEVTGSAARVNTVSPPAPIASEPVQPAAPAKPSEPVQATEPVQPPAPAEAAPASANTAPWAVIAATYATFGDAQRRAETMQKQHPQLRPRVVPPAGKGKYYFVVLGSGLTQKAAESLRREAVSLGVPRDTYVTKLDES